MRCTVSCDILRWLTVISVEDLQHWLMMVVLDHTHYKPTEL